MFYPTLTFVKTMGKTLHSGERTVILKVLEFFENEKRNHMSRIPVDLVIRRACLATGVCKSTLLRIKREAKRLRADQAASAASTASPGDIRLPTPGKHRKPRSTRIQLDRLELCALRVLVDSFYTLGREIPTLGKVLAAAKADLGFPAQKSYLRLVLANKLHYRTIKCKDGRRYLVQKPEIRAWRARYLRRLMDNDELDADKKPVIYVGETKIKIANKTCQNADASAKKHNPEQEWVIVHAGGDDGFVAGAELVYESKSSSGDPASFVAYLEDQLIPNLPPRSIVVLGDAPRSARVGRPPAPTAPEHRVRQWLQERGVPFDDDLTKFELYDLIRANKPPKRYAADELLERHEHEVLRLPPAPHLCDLNPLEYIWKVINASVADRDPTQYADGIDLVRAAVRSVFASDWRAKVQRAHALRQRCWHDDRLLEECEATAVTEPRSDSGSSDDGDDGDDSDDEPPQLPADLVQVMMSSSDDDSA